MTLVGAVLRFWGPGRLGLNHFDEGIYALAATWSSAPKGLASISPELIAYAPPLYPILVGIIYLFLGVSDVSAILVSQIAGTLTIPAVAWVARRTFGSGVGAAAAALVALSGPHIAFSRMALTDATFLLCWVLSLGLGGRFLERPGLLRAIAFGLMVGLAQNAKYNGYLAGGIVAVAAVWGMVRKPGDGLRVMGYGLVAAAVAALIYLPWYRFVESHPGGYAGLVKHHRSYLSGPRAWPMHWRLQMGQSYALSGALTEGLTWGIFAWPLAWVGGTMTSGIERKTRRSQVRARMGFVLGMAFYGVAPNLGWWVSLAMLPWLIAGSRVQRVLGIGWLVMAILTPFYHPYARLWLPLHAFGWMALAGLVRDDPKSSRWNARLRGASLAFAIIAGMLSDAVREPRFRSLGSPVARSDAMRTACIGVASELARALAIVPERLQIVARPPVVFYLAAQLKVPILRQPDILPAARSARSGDYLLMDSTLERVSSPDGYPFPAKSFRTKVMSSSRFLLFFDTPPATALDLDPGVAFDPHAHIDTQRYFELYPIVPR